MATAYKGGATALPAHIALSLIPSLPRPQLERLVQRLIDGLDSLDGDPDDEPEETDHARSEDDCLSAQLREPDTRTFPKPLYGIDQRMLLRPSPIGLVPMRLD